MPKNNTSELVAYTLPGITGYIFHVSMQYINHISLAVGITASVCIALPVGKAEGSDATWINAACLFLPCLISQRSLAAEIIRALNYFRWRFEHPCVLLFLAEKQKVVMLNRQTWCYSYNGIAFNTLLLIGHVSLVVRLVYHEIMPQTDNDWLVVYTLPDHIGYISIWYRQL